MYILKSYYICNFLGKVCYRNDVACKSQYCTKPMAECDVGFSFIQLSFQIISRRENYKLNIVMAVLPVPVWWVRRTNVELMNCMNLRSDIAIVSRREVFN